MNRQISVKQKRRIVLLLMIIVCSVFILAFGVSNASAGTYEGNGTESDPYEVDSINDWFDIPNHDADAYYVVIQDIDGQGIEDDLQNTNAITGTIDGQNHTISNYSVYPETLSGPAGTYTNFSGTLKNIKLDDVDATPQDASDVGIISGMSTDGKFRNIVIENSSVTGDNEVSGLVGVYTHTNIGITAFKNIKINNTNIISNGGAYGITKTNAGGDQAKDFVNIDINNVTYDSQSEIGGITRGSQDNIHIENISIDNSDIVDGRFIGGIITGTGANNTIINSYAEGDITTQQGQRTGGISNRLNPGMNIVDSFSAYNIDESGSDVAGTVAGDLGGDMTSTDLYCDTSLNNNCIGDTAGYNTNFISLTTSEMTGSSAETNMGGLDFQNTWETQSNDYPDLQSQPITLSVTLSNINYIVNTYDEVLEVNQTTEIYTNLSSSSNVTYTLPDGTTKTTSANESVEYTPTSGGVKDIVAEYNGTQEIKEVIVVEDPTSVLDIYPGQNIYEGDDITFEANDSEPRTTAARPDPNQLTAEIGLQTWIPYAYSTGDDGDALGSGVNHRGYILTERSNYDNPTNDGVGIYTNNSKSYVDTSDLNFSDSWGISTYYRQGDSFEDTPIWITDNGHGVAIESGSVYRIAQNEKYEVGSVPTEGVLTVTHNSDGVFEYYVDGQYIGFDNTAEINDSRWIEISPNKAGPINQTVELAVDDFRVYNRYLDEEDAGNIANQTYKLETKNESELETNWYFDGNYWTSETSFTLDVSAGTYTVELETIDADGNVNTTTKNFTVSTVVSPNIENVVPSGVLNTRDTTISAYISHRDISSNYTINVTLNRFNEQVGTSETLIDTTISSNQTVSFNADHLDVEGGNLGIDEEKFNYEWIVEEPKQNVRQYESREYTIPVFRPYVENLSPQGNLDNRYTTISADVGHRNIDTKYPVDVQMIRINEQTGEVETLVNKEITSNQTISYDADHTNTGVENYDVDREYFTYRVTATESQQNLVTENEDVYNIPVEDIVIESISPSGLRNQRDVTVNVNFSKTLNTSVDATLTLYNYRTDTTEEVYTETIPSGTSASYTINHSLNTSDIPDDYATANLYNYQWKLSTDTSTATSETKTYKIPGLVYLIKENGEFISQSSTLGNSSTSDGVHDIRNILDLSSGVNTYYDQANTSGRYQAGVFMADFSRSYTALLYDESDSSVFEQTFSPPESEFNFVSMDVSDSYMVLEKEIDGKVVEVAQEPFGANSEATVTVRDGETYQLSIFDGEKRRTIGSWTADQSTANETESVEPAPVDFSNKKGFEYKTSTNYNKTSGNGTIVFEFDSNEDDISNLNLNIVRVNDSRIMLQDEVDGNVDDYQVEVSINKTDADYRVSWTAYDRGSNQTISSTDIVRINYSDIGGELNQSYLTAISVVIILSMLGIVAQISAPYAIFVPILVGGVLSAIGWFPITGTVILQALAVAVIYFISRRDAY